MAINAGTILAYLDLDTSKFGNALQLAQQQMGDFADNGGGVSGMLDGVGAAATTVGHVLTVGVSAPLIGIGTKAVTMGMEFDAQMSRVQAISGATAEEFGTLRTAAIQMGADSVFGATDAAQALEYMAMAGWKTDQMIAGLPGIIDLAAASGENLGAVSDIVTDALTAFGLSAADAGSFADVLAAASSSSNTSVGLMGDTFKYVAPLAGALGYTVEDTALAIGLMANAGIKGSQAGTALRGMLSNLAKPTDQVAEAMERYGISLTDAQGNMLPFGDLLGNLRGVFAGLTEVQKAELAATLAGQEGMSGLLAIVNASEADYNKLAGAIDNSAGATQTMAATMLDNLKGDFEGLSGALEGVALTFSDFITPAVRGVVQGLTRAVDWFNGLSEGTRTLAFRVGAAVAALGPALTIGGKLLGAFSPVIPVLAAVGGAFALIYGRSERLQSITAKLRTDGIAAFAGLRSGVQSYQEQVAAGATVTDAFSSALTVAFGSEAGARISGVMGRFVAGYRGAQGVLQGSVAGVGEFIASLIDGQGAAASLEEGLQAAFGGNVPERVRALQTGIGQLMTDIRSDFAAGGVIAVARGLGGRIAEALREGWGALTDGAQGLRDTLTSGLALTREWIAPKAREWMQNIGTALRTGSVQRGLGKLTAVGGAIMERITEGKSLLTDKAGELLTWLGEALGSDDAQSKLGNLTTIAAGIAGRIASGMGSWRVTAGTLIGGLVTQLTDSGFLATALEGIGDIVISIAEGLGTAAGNMATAAEQIITQLVASVTDNGLIERTFTQAGTLITKIAGIIGVAAPGIITAAAAIATSLLNGLTGLDWPTIFTTASTVITSIAGVLSSVAGDIVTAAASLGKELLTGLAGLDWATLFTAAGTIVSDIGTTLASNASQIAGAALDLGKALLTGLAAVDWAGVSSSLATACGNLVQALVAWFSVPENVQAVGEAAGTIAEGILYGALKAVNPDLVYLDPVELGLSYHIVQYRSGSTGAAEWAQGVWHDLRDRMHAGSLTASQEIAGATALVLDGFYEQLQAEQPDLAAQAAQFNKLFLNAFNVEDIQATFGQMGYSISDNLAMALNNGTVQLADALRGLSLGMNEEMILAMDQNFNMDAWLQTYFSSASTDVGNLLTNEAVNWGKIFGRAIPEGATAGLEDGMLKLRDKTGEVIAIVSAVDAQTTVVTGNKDTAQAGIDAASKTLGDGETAVGEAAQGVVDAAVTPFADLPPEAQVQAAVMMEGINAAITAGTPAATTAIDTAANAVTGRAAEILNNGAGSAIGQDFAGGIGNGILSKQSGLRIAARGVATGGVSAASAAMSSGDGYSIGQNMVQGIIDGVGSMASALASRMRRLASGAVSAFRGALDMHSPSVVLMGDGALMAQSIGLGVTRGSEEAIRSMVALAGDMQQAWPGVEVDGANVTDNPHSRGAGDTDGGGYVFNFYGDITVREEADIQKVSAALAEEMRDMLRGRGY